MEEGGFESCGTIVNTQILKIGEEIVLSCNYI